MARPVCLSNGSLFIGLNKFGLVDDIYFPYVGLENLKTSRLIPHKIGVFVDDKFSWLDDGTWEVSLKYEYGTMVSEIVFSNEKLNLEIQANDAVDYDENAFMRSIKVINKLNRRRTVKVFLHQVFQISRNGRADTAFYVPDGNYIFDYKGHTAIIVYSHNDGLAFNEFAVGNYAIEGKSGTFKDAEDGELSGNLVEHGGIDSVIAHSLDLGPQEWQKIEYWLAFGDTQQDAYRVHQRILDDSLEGRLNATRTNWHQWLTKASDNLPVKLSQTEKENALSSLLTIKAHIDKNGGIIASGDSSLYNYGRDYYAYCWPRDGAYSLWPLIKLGYFEEARKFFDFFAQVMHPDGYLQHKYQTDGAFGSTWHPQVQEHHKELAIQEDETAIILLMIAEYDMYSQDADYFMQTFNRFVRPCAEFLANYIDSVTHLPHPSYDLWEQKFLSTTYTSYLVSAALRRIAEVTERYYQDEATSRWLEASAIIEKNLDKYYDRDLGYYIKGFKIQENGEYLYDKTLDASSIYPLFTFSKQLENQSHLTKSADAIERQLMNGSLTGVARYTDDDYLRNNPKDSGNPWFICTFWYVQYLAKTGHIERAEKLLEWTSQRFGANGMISEQIDPKTSKQLGVGPLIWSHAEYINCLILLRN